MIATDPGAAPDPLGPDLAGRVWFVLEIATGAEADVCAALAARSGLGVVAWSHRRVRRGRNRHTYVDRWANAAPGYLFAALAGVGSAAWAAGLRDVRGVLGVEDVPSPVPAREVAAFLAAVAPATRPKRRPRTAQGAPSLAPGDAVEVIAGPFMGERATVEAVRDGGAVVSVPFLGSVRPVQIFVDDLRKIGA